jgi:hypothetical protein
MKKISFLLLGTTLLFSACDQKKKYGPLPLKEQLRMPLRLKFTYKNYLMEESNPLF